MSFDGIITRAIVHELKKILIGGKINKVNQPGKNDLMLSIYCPNHHDTIVNKKNVRLRISASSNLPCIYITEKTKENPMIAPSFCMFLRKHIQNGVITDIRQIGLDRNVHFDIDTFDELGDLRHLTLIIELMGKYSNVILVDQESNKIMDALKKITMDMSSIRQIFPGIPYQYISSGKYNILDERIPKPSDLFCKEEKPIKLFQLFYRFYEGFGPMAGREIAYQSGLNEEIKTNVISESDKKRIDQAFDEFIKKVIENDDHPTIYYDEKGNILDCYCFELAYLGTIKETFQTMSSMFDVYYAHSKQEDTVSQKAMHLKKIISQKLNRDLKKYENLEKDLIDAKDRDTYKLYGDLLSANVHQLKKGMSVVRLENFFDDMKPVDIPLNVNKSPWDNVQNYYKNFSKRKKREQIIKEDLPQLKEEIAYLNTILDLLERSTHSSEIDEIRDEMVEMKLVKNKKKKKASSKKSKPYHFKSPSGSDIYIGKNNHQNDELTLKVAHKDDLFFHAKDIPGSHVILRHQNITEEDIEVAAFLAAKFSKEGEESSVLVDYTEKKNVRKAKNAKPGMVYYDNFKTIVVNTKKYRVEDLNEMK